MDTFPTTEPRLTAVQLELLRHEVSFHWPTAGMVRDDFARMTEPDFWEVGASGRRYGREEVFDVLDARRASLDDDPGKIEGCTCRELGANHFLLTYTLRQSRRLTRRSTVWHRTGEGWKIVYHQGTVVPQPEAGT